MSFRCAGWGQLSLASAVWRSALLTASTWDSGSSRGSQAREPEAREPALQEISQLLMVEGEGPC